MARRKLTLTEQVKNLRKLLLGHEARMHRIEAEIVRAAQEVQVTMTAERQRVTREHHQLNLRMTAIEKAQNAIDGREVRLTGAIEQATQAALVMQRVERGLRPMLVTALERDKTANWMEEAYTDAVERCLRSAYAARSV